MTKDAVPEEVTNYSDIDKKLSELTTKTFNSLIEEAFATDPDFEDITWKKCPTFDSNIHENLIPIPSVAKKLLPIYWKYIKDTDEMEEEIRYLDLQLGEISTDSQITLAYFGNLRDELGTFIDFLFSKELIKNGIDGSRTVIVLQNKMMSIKIKKIFH